MLRKFSLVGLTLTLTLGFALQADPFLILRDRPVRLQGDGLFRWADAIGKIYKPKIDAFHFKGWEDYTECAEVVGLPSVYLCLSYELAVMNRMFTRLSAFSEGQYRDKPGREPLREMEHRYTIASVKRTAGHDIRGKAAIDFFKVGRRDKSLNEWERRFERQALRTIVEKYGDRFVLLAASIDSPGSLVSTVGHEILHAQFFTDEVFRGTTIEYYQSLHASRRKAMVKVLAKLGYAADDAELMANEMMAYLLNPDAGAAAAYFRKWVPECSDQLLENLAYAGSPAIQLPSRDPRLPVLGAKGFPLPQRRPLPHKKN